MTALELALRVFLVEGGFQGLLEELRHTLLRLFDTDDFGQAFELDFEVWIRMVEDEEIAEVLKSEKHSEMACDALVHRALDHGGKYNVTVVVAGYKIPEG